MDIIVPESQSMPHKSGLAMARKGTRLLVVDDDKELRDALVFIFKKHGFEVFSASDGLEGFEMAIKHNVEVVLSDVRMPRCDGIQLLDKLKGRDPRHPAVILITGYADITLEEAYHKGADALLQKPFDRQLLSEVVMRAITPEDQRWAEQIESAEVALNIELRFSELGEAVKARLINLGRGGMLVALSDQLPVISQTVFFNIEFTGASPLLIEGTGVVRWVKLRDSGETPRGCGIEFTSLSDRSRRGVIELIQRLQTRAFIPKS